MRPSCALLVLAACCPAAVFAAPAASPNAPLQAYQGNWKVTRQSAKAEAKAESLQNQCAALGRFYACQQSVNGSDTGLLIFIPSSQSGRFITQNISPDGRAAGKGELEIAGNRWTMTHTWNQGSTVTRYRTIHVINDKNHIHFEQEESPDGVHWQTKDSGDYVRAAGAAR